jgi:hypothetical protein
VEVLFRACLPGLWEKRSGRGVFVDLIVRMEVYAMASLEDCEPFCRMRKRVADGMRKDGGNKAQLRGVLGGIVDVACGFSCSGVEFVLVDFRNELGPIAAREVVFTKIMGAKPYVDLSTLNVSMSKRKGKVTVWPTELRSSRL